MQVILGAGGAIGRELAKSLPNYTQPIRLVSRNPQRVNSTDELFSADLTQADQVLKAIKGAEVVYLTIGLPYNAKIWESTWPVVIKNTLDACKIEGAKLVFFDNVYMYDPETLGNIKEDNPISPSSKKGKVRAKIAEMITNAHKKGEVKTLIARAADFYGPGIENVSVMTESVFKPLSEGKKAQLIGDVSKKHSFTFTPDAGKATALLGNTTDAYGEVWHLPTAANPYSMKEYVEIIAERLQVAPKMQSANKFLTRSIGLFVPVMKELSEMYYQYDRDYIFNSEKFENRFEFKPTPYLDGIDVVIQSDYNG